MRGVAWRGGKRVSALLQTRFRGAAATWGKAQPPHSLTTVVTSRDPARRRHGSKEGDSVSQLRRPLGEALAQVSGFTERFVKLRPRRGWSSLGLVRTPNAHVQPPPREPASWGHRATLSAPSPPAL